MNTYENAVPKPLKFLVSDGKLVDDAGNVIAESESLKEKYLLSDGSVVDEEGNLIIKNDYYKKMYDQADPKVAKYLHSDGTIDENPGSGSGADLEDNHQTTIDVSTYTEPVEIEPTADKDGMKKATVTLSNIPSGKVTAYAWHAIVEGEDVDVYFDFDVAPQTLEELLTHFAINNESSIIQVKKIDSVIGDEGFTRISDTKFSMTDGSDVFVLERSYSGYDFTLWEED